MEVLSPEDPREPPVHDVDLAELPHHHVRGLEVAVDHALGVCEGHRLTDAQEHAEHARRVPLLVPREDLVVLVPELLPVDELHREVDLPALVHAELVHRDDAGMLKLASDLRLIQEAPHGARVDGGVLGLSREPSVEHDLHGHVAADVAVEDPQDRAHPPARELLLHVVALIGL